MPFDGARLYPDKPNKPFLTEGRICALLVVLAVALMIMPISLDGMVDIVRAIRGH